MSLARTSAGTRGAYLDLAVGDLGDGELGNGGGANGEKSKGDGEAHLDGGWGFAVVEDGEGLKRCTA